jgi:hypothetical protein
VQGGERGVVPLRCMHHTYVCAACASVMDQSPGAERVRLQKLHEVIEQAHSAVQRLHISVLTEERCHCTFARACDLSNTEQVCCEPVTRHGALTHVCVCSHGAQEHVYQICEDNVRALYEACDWDWDPTSKRAELFHLRSLYLLIRAEDSIVGFVHFRVTEDDEGVSPLYTLTHKRTCTQTTRKKQYYTCTRPRCDWTASDAVLVDT